MPRYEDNIAFHSLYWSQDNSSQHAVCEALVASHQRAANPDGLGSGRYNLTKDLLDVQVDETFMGQTATITALPRRPYFHWVFPGDWISIYMSTGIKSKPDFGVLGDPEELDDDIRVFFGFIDSIKPTVTVADNGTTIVRVAITCSGMQKAFDRTQVYHNPQLSPSTLFGAILPGLSNLMRGIYVSGTPASIPRSIALAYLGFGGQFVMPDTYKQQIGDDDSRKAQIKYQLQRSQAVERSLGFLFGEGQENKAQKPGLVERVLKASQDQFEANSLAQVLDLFTYVEDMHVAGRIVQSPFHDLQGSLWQMMLENSNPPMNECFLSLMPDRSNVLKGDRDEWGKSPKYVPSLIIRERPFTWVDGRAYRMSRSNSAQWKFWLPSQFGKDEEEVFGDVFFSSRAVPALSPRLQRFHAKEGQATGVELEDIWRSGLIDKDKDRRFIERIIIKSSDIQNEHVGLSDNDQFNFFTISVANMALAQGSQKFMLLQDGLMPVFVPESIRRYGLRMKDITTKFMHQGGKVFGGKSAMSFMIRSLLCHDMWYQHQPWYRAGTMVVRPMPKARVGMALDVMDRDESFYIEGVSHSWNRNPGTGAGRLITTLTVTRGQPGLRHTYMRFNYAPPDPVRMFVGNAEIPRPPLAKQPVTMRNPYDTTDKKVIHMLEVIAEAQKEMGDDVVDQQDIKDFYDELGKLAGTGLVTLPLIQKAMQRAEFPQEFITNVNNTFTSDAEPVALPPFYKVKEDRTNAGKPPWVTQPELVGKMWDPIRRPENDNWLSMASLVMELEK